MCVYSTRGCQRQSARRLLGDGGHGVDLGLLFSRSQGGSSSLLLESHLAALLFANSVVLRLKHLETLALQVKLVGLVVGWWGVRQSEEVGG